MTNSISIRVNGRVRQVPAGESLAQLVGEMGLDERYLVVEWNGEAFAYAEIRARELLAGDRLELVRPVAGG
jgi:thiamine biosynthesis protein ThiS